MKACPDLHSTGRAAVALHDVERVPGEARVMHDARARLLLQEGLGQQAHQVVALDELPALIEEEAAVVVAVPGQSHVRTAARARRPRSRRGSPPASGWARRCGKVPSGSWLTLMNSNGRCGSSASMIRPAPPLPAFTTTFSLRRRVRSHVAEQVLEVLRRGCRAVAPLPVLAALPGSRPLSISARISMQAGVAADRAAPPRARTSCRCSRAGCGSRSP